jgi:hypothetical protein
VLQQLLVPPPAWALLPGGVLFAGCAVAPRSTAGVAVFGMLLVAATKAARWIGGPR